LNVTLFGDNNVEVLLQDGLNKNPKLGPKNTLEFPNDFCNPRSILIIGNEILKECSLIRGTIIPFTSLTKALLSVVDISTDPLEKPIDPRIPQSVGIHSIFPIIPNCEPIPPS
jgi:hypothetical protein